MKAIHQYNFYRKKYGLDLPIDVVAIKDFKKFIDKNPIHRLSYFDLTFIVEGNEELDINEYRMLVGRGDIVCSFPGQVWRWQENTKLEGYALVFEEDFLLSFFRDRYFLRNLNYLQVHRSSPLLTTNEEQFEILLQHLKLLRSEILKRAGSNTDVLRALLYLILSLLKDCDLKPLNNVEQTKGLAINRYIESFTALVETNFLTRRDLSFYADKLFITTNYLNKITKEVLGTTAKTYILNKTIGEAKNLLNYSSMSIAEISEKLNIETPSYFVRMFRKSTGMTPREFRNNSESKSGN
ncbi:helix-turn-helix domain-containing protein [Chitinophaga sancti]|uniref:AraC family transcriptional regulator n=1 Tax=Chitinophaga sancti TaxID=1004 RepID=A0A1K1R5C1_9BACT|nr:AraC family transcriptional regulator [Chitinophaga sancti]WQD64252.1 AraC family transcriptional regulator [Chitinophaga sancti]WQG90124.1 AraC family transcriptional regulator [Chitinophaga sancti]SFW67051.1 AraC-type DNA-binding protein [Chitinophaga sancti]